MAHSHECLGLAYVREMVRLLWDRLDIHSEQGRGSCVTITLPTPPRSAVPERL